MNDDTWLEIAPSVVSYVRDWGSYARGQLSAEKSVERKGGRADVVTAVDREIQSRMVPALLGLLADSYLIGEEDISVDAELAGRVIPYSDVGSDSELFQRGYVWIVDPLDGTTNYSHALPIYSISVALYREGRPVLGVIYAPSTDEMFHAIAGRGAYLNGRPIHTSDVRDTEMALAVTGYPYDFTEAPERVLRLLNRFSVEVQEVRALGSAALELAYMAAGKLDLYWEEGLKPWDTAAGVLLLEEAGGVVSDYHGGKFDNFRPEIIAASTKELHSKAVGIVKDELGL